MLWKKIPIFKGCLNLLSWEAEGMKGRMINLLYRREYQKILRSVRPSLWIDVGIWEYGACAAGPGGGSMVGAWDSSAYRDQRMSEKQSFEISDSCDWVKY